MRALLKIDYFLTKRNLSGYLLGIGMPVLFFLLFSSMFDSSYGDVSFLIRNYLLTMTAFSMSSFALFSFPSILKEDEKNGCLLQLQHAPIPLYRYYLAKVLTVLLSFVLAIIINFIVGAVFRDVQMSAEQWLFSAVLLLVTGLVYLAIGLALTLLKNQQLVSVVGNILFLVLAIFGGSWMPYETLRNWMQTVAHFMPSYYANQLVLGFVKNNQLNFKFFLILFLYTIILVGLTLGLKKRQEVR